MLVDADEGTQHCVVENSESLSTISNSSKDESQQLHLDAVQSASCQTSSAVTSDKPITSTTWTPSSDLNEKEWEAGILLVLRQKYFLPFDALMMVSSAMHDFYERRVLKIQV